MIIIGLNEDLEAVVIPSVIDGMKVTGIGGYAFALCTNLTSIEIPDSVTYIEEGAFDGCSSLTSIKVPKDSDAENWFKENGFSVESY